jgi:hypothetical protein
MTELASLLERQQQLLAKVDELDATQREAAAAVARASDELVRLERAALGGQKITPRARAEAEQALSAARVEAAQPLRERRAAAQQASEDARAAAQVYVGEHLDALLADLGADGRRAVEAIDAAAEALLANFDARAAVEQRTFALISMVRPVRPGDVQRARSEPVAAAARALLDQGGEVPPDVLVRPDEPRQVVAGARVSA